MTVQTRSYPYGQNLLQNAIYDVSDKIGAKMISGDSGKGEYRIKMPDGYAELDICISGDPVCAVTVTAGNDKVPKYGYEQESWTIQHLFSNLELLLAGLEKP